MSFVGKPVTPLIAKYFLHHTNTILNFVCFLHWYILQSSLGYEPVIVIILHQKHLGGVRVTRRGDKVGRG